MLTLLWLLVVLTVPVASWARPAPVARPPAPVGTLAATQPA